MDERAEYHASANPVHDRVVTTRELLDRARKRPDDRAAFWRWLMQPDVSLEQAQAEMYRRHFAGRAASSTLEALMYSLRQRGTVALKEAPARHRLGQLSETQLHEISARLQKLKPAIARAWIPDEVRLLIEAWAICHGR